MSADRPPFAARPTGRAVSVEDWVRRERNAAPKAELYTARLTIDVTPALRSRIKLAAFAQGLTVAEMLRDLLKERFPEAGTGAGGAS